MQHHASSNLDTVNGHCKGLMYTLQELHVYVLDAVLPTALMLGSTWIFIPHIPIITSDNTISFQHGLSTVQIPCETYFSHQIKQGTGQSCRTVLEETILQPWTVLQ